MKLIIFPIILVYFMLGWFFSKCDKDPVCEEVDSIMHFLFWPVVLIYIVIYELSYIIACIFKKTTIITHNIYRLIKKSIIKKRRISF